MRLLRLRLVIGIAGYGLTMTPQILMSDRFDEPNAELVLKIDYVQKDGSAARVFEIAAELIKSFEEIDSVLAKSIDSSLQTALIVEDLQKSSIKIFLRNVLRNVDDDALKTLDWRPLIGGFLVKGKYAVLRWCDQDVSKNNPPRITDLTNEIARLASETDVRHLPDYPPPNPSRMLQAADRFQNAKGRLGLDEKLTITLDKKDYTVDLSKTWSPSELTPEPEGPKELVNEQETYLLIHKPDMLGAAKWQFKLGKTALSASIEDPNWKADFQARRVSIYPGDVLHVKLRIEQKFTEKGELAETTHKIIRVLGVIEKSPQTGQLDF